MALQETQPGRGFVSTRPGDTKPQVMGAMDAMKLDPLLFTERAKQRVGGKRTVACMKSSIASRSDYRLDANIGIIRRDEPAMRGFHAIGKTPGHKEPPPEFVGTAL